MLASLGAFKHTVRTQVTFLPPLSDCHLLFHSVLDCTGDNPPPPPPPGWEEERGVFASLPLRSVIVSAVLLGRDIMAMATLKESI